jgi:hypothetical protein
MCHTDEPAMMPTSALGINVGTREWGLDCGLMTEECFGPISSIVTVNGHDAATRQIRGRLQPASVYVFDALPTATPCRQARAGKW